jgi:hypothetical protein
VQSDQLRSYPIKVAVRLIAAARAPHASADAKTRAHIESLGKCGFQQGGKDRVNEKSEYEKWREFLAHGSCALDCFASLAMTGQEFRHRHSPHRHGRA